MQTFMKMAGAVYTMAGLGTIEDSRFFKDKFDAMDGQDTKMLDFRRDDDQDSLAEEAEQALLRGVSGSKKVTNKSLFNSNSAGIQTVIINRQNLRQTKGRATTLTLIWNLNLHLMQLFILTVRIYFYIGLFFQSCYF